MTLPQARTGRSVGALTSLAMVGQTMTPESARPAAAAHAVPVPGGDWFAWRELIIRGTGFPASLVLELAGDLEPAAADRCLRAEADVERCRAALFERMRDFGAGSDKETVRRLRMIRRRIEHGTVPDDCVGAEADALRSALAARAAARTELAWASSTDASALLRRLSGILEDSRFEEAMLWQNRSMVPIARKRIREGRGSASDVRQTAETVAMYVQRYAAKNDSIGFFGPVCWAAITDEPVVVDARPGRDLLEKREVYFEQWCIDALTARLNEEPSLRRWTTPRLWCGTWIAPDGVYAAARGRVETTSAEQQLIRLCDGDRTATEIVDLLLATSRLVASADEAFELLEGLVRKNLVVWQLEVRPQLHPDRELAARIARIGDPELRARCSAALDALASGRDRVAAAVGRPADLFRRMGEFEETFTAITGVPPTRRAGKTYAARALLYEDCRRACDVTFGSRFMEQIGPPLSIALDAARWVAVELAAAARAYLRTRFAEARGRLQLGDAVPAHRFFASIHRGGLAPLERIVEEPRRRYLEAWQSVLRLDGTERRRVYAVEEIAERARHAFATHGSAWTRAGYICPDLMVAADGIEAFARGEFHCVLGELHGTNSLLASVLVSQHPDPSVIARYMADDTRVETVVVPQVPAEEWLSRANNVVAPNFWRYEYAPDLPPPGACRSLPAALLEATDDGRTVVIRARDGRVEFDALELFGAHLCDRLHSLIAQRLPRLGHTPRVTIGPLTIARETWNLTPADLPFLGLLDRHAQYVAVRRWVQEQGMPRQAFYRSPAERKPCYLDFDSRIYTDIFIKLMRRLEPDAPVRIVEMFPTIENAWLPDASGRRYMCELRMAARRVS